MMIDLEILYLYFMSGINIIVAYYLLFTQNKKITNLVSMILCCVVIYMFLLIDTDISRSILTKKIEVIVFGGSMLPLIYIYLRRLRHTE